MNNKYVSFSVGWKVRFLGCLLIMLNLILIYINNSMQWRALGIVILICALITLANLFTLKYEVTNEALVVRTFFKTQYVYVKDIKNITLEDNLVYGMITHIYIQSINKNESNKKWNKTTIPSFINNYRLLVKEIIKISENNKSIFIEDKVSKLASSEK